MNVGPGAGPRQLRCQRTNLLDRCLPQKFNHARPVVRFSALGRRLEVAESGAGPAFEVLAWRPKATLNFDNDGPRNGGRLDTTSRVVNQPPSTGFNIGGYYVLDQHNQLLFSGGRGLQSAAETNRVSTYIGYQLSF